MEELKFRLDAFEGPLDLLLSLITKQKIDIYDIPIALIFDQYMEYIEEARMLDMEVAGEFITMAAELMLIKSRMLLPKVQSGDKEDPRAALAAAIDPVLTIHDFRTTAGPHHTNLIFDVVIPFSFHLTDDQVCAQLTQSIKELSDRYYTVINVDHSYLEQQKG